jgi:hypothetical protein
VGEGLERRSRLSGELTERVGGVVLRAVGDRPVLPVALVTSTRSAMTWRWPPCWGLRCRSCWCCGDLGIVAALGLSGPSSEGLSTSLRCNVRDMEGLLASVVLIAILLGVLLVVGSLVYLLALRAHRLSKRPPEPVTMRPKPLLGREPWFGPGCRGYRYRYSPASPEGHAVGLVAIGAAVYLAQAGQILACVAVAATMVIIVFVKGTPPGGARAWKEFQARDQRPGTAGH